MEPKESFCKICGKAHTTGFCTTPEGKKCILEATLFVRTNEEGFGEALKGAIERGEVTKEEAEALVDKYLGARARRLSFDYEHNPPVLQDRKAKLFHIRELHQLRANAQEVNASQAIMDDIDKAFEGFARRWPEMKRDM